MRARKWKRFSPSFRDSARLNLRTASYQIRGMNNMNAIRMHLARQGRDESRPYKETYS